MIKILKMKLFNLLCCIFVFDLFSLLFHYRVKFRLNIYVYHAQRINPFVGIFLLFLKRNNVLSGM